MYLLKNENKTIFKFALSLILLLKINISFIITKNSVLIYMPII